MKSVYSAVRTGSLNKAVCASSLNGQSVLAAEHNIPYTAGTFNSTDNPNFGEQKVAKRQHVHTWVYGAHGDNENK
jgi:hypothetical protein